MTTYTKKLYWVVICWSVLQILLPVILRLLNNSMWSTANLCSILLIVILITLGFKMSGWYYQGNCKSVVKSWLLLCMELLVASELAFILVYFLYGDKDMLGLCNIFSVNFIL